MTAPAAAIETPDEPTVRMMQTHLLRTEPAAQRSLDETRVAKMAADWKPHGVGVISVSHRGGNYYIIDGQHRVAALRSLGRTTDVVKCDVYEGLTVPQEAEMFRLLNTAVKPRALEVFKVRITAEDPIALGILGIITDAGWRLGQGDTDGVFGAVSAAESVYSGRAMRDKTVGPTAFRDALNVATAAWGHRPAASDGRIIHGLGLVFGRYGSEIDKPSLIKRLAQFNGGPDGFIGQARSIKAWRGGAVSRAAAELTVDLYNRRRTKGQLEDWRS